MSHNQWLPTNIVPSQDTTVCSVAVPPCIQQHTHAWPALVDCHLSWGQHSAQHIQPEPQQDTHSQGLHGCICVSLLRDDPVHPEEGEQDQQPRTAVCTTLCVHMQLLCLWITFLGPAGSRLNMLGYRIGQRMLELLTWRTESTTQAPKQEIQFLVCGIQQTSRCN